MLASAGRRWSLSAGIVLGLVAGLLTATPASAAIAAPTGLSPAGTAVSASPTLSWSRVDAAAKYEVQVSSSSAFSPLLFSIATTNIRATPKTQLQAGLAYWRVRGISAQNVASAWADQTFTVSSTAAPQPTTPANGTVLQQPQSPPLLSWQAVPGAVGYRIEVDPGTDFIGATAYSTKSTSFVVPDPKSGGTYSWRVQAQLASGLNTAFSSVGNYRIADLTGVVTTAPAENATVQDVVLQWNPVAGAKTYDLLVSTDQDFNTIVDSKTGLKGTRYSPPVTYLNNQYYWKVRPRNNLGETIEWADVAIHNFRRDWPQQPALKYPPDSFTPTVGGDLYFQWTAVPRATRYQLDVGNDPNFSPNTYETCYTAATTYTPGILRPTGGSNDLCLPGQGTPQYWRVRALDDPADAPRGVQGIYSPIGRFIYDSGPVSLTSPANGATVAVPTLTWQPVRAAEKYRVIVTGGAGFRKQVDTYALSWAPTVALDPTKSPFTWTVQSIAASGSVSPLRAGRTFTLAGNPATSGIAPLTPITGDGGSPTTRFPNLTWEPITGAAYYRVQVGVAGTGYWYPLSQSAIMTDEFPFPSATDTGKGILSPGDYDWGVVAFDKDNVRLDETPPFRYGTFTILDSSVVGGQQLALSGLSLDADEACTAYLDAPAQQPTKCVDVPTTPVLDWTPVPEASHYMVYVAQDRELTNMVYTGVLTSNSRWTPRLLDNPMALPDSQAGQAYYWFIRPCKAINVCAPDPISTDAAATHAFNKKSPPVQLVAPAQDATVANQVTFTWDDYLTTNQSTIYAYSPTVGEPSAQSGKQYRIQVSQSESFATTIDTMLVDQPTYTAFTETYPEGVLFWRVQAVDAEGNSLTWSPARRFTKASPAPSLTAPVNGVATNGVAPFSWQPTNYAGSYQLEVYKNNDINLSAVNRVVSYTSKQTAYATPAPLPASNLPYLWRVARLDADGRPGLWSTVESFVSRGNQPSLLTPTVGEIVNGYSAYFAWGAVPGAVNYRFERKLATATTAAETVTTAGLAWAPMSSLASGAWQWRVTALDVNGNTIGVTDWRGLTVDNTRGLFTPLSPRRVLDTRIGVGAYKRQLGPGQSLTLTIPGLPASATAVTLNVTATKPTVGGHLIVSPGGQVPPKVSNLNFVKGQTIANLVTVSLGVGSRVMLTNYAGYVDVVADLEGYYAPDSSSGFTSLNPTRVLDTRVGIGAAKAQLGAGASLTLEVPGLPADATAVALNVTVTNASAGGYVTAYPGGQSRPTASNINFVKGQTIAGMTTVAVGPNGTVTITNAYGRVDVVADLSGYFAPSTGSLFKGQAPKRVLDTRFGVGAPKAMVGSGKTISLTIPGLPEGTTAVALNVTATQPTTSSYTTVYPDNGSARTSASNVNYVKNETIPNFVLVAVGPGNRVKLFNAYGNVHLIADVAGYYAP